MVCKVYSVVVVLLFLSITQAHAQASYTFTNFVAKSRPYVDLVDDIVVPGFESTLFKVPSLDGQVFKFYGREYTLGPNTAIALGEGGYIALNLAPDYVFIDGILMDLDPIDSTSRVSYSITGEPGDYLLVYQYKHHRIRTGPADNFVNLQMRIYQRTGRIEVQYGPHSLNNESGYTIENGPNAGMVRSSANFQVLEKLWCSGSPNEPEIDSSTSVFLPTLTGIPFDGTIYAYTPRDITSGVDDDSDDVNTDSDHLNTDPDNAIAVVTVYDLLGNVCKGPLSPGFYLEHTSDAKGRGHTRGFIQQ